MDYIKYQHVERLGTSETDGILDGLAHVFPKLDGTNGHIWMDDGELKFGSRRRELSLDSDNAGFMAAMVKEEKPLRYLFKQFPDAHIFGEWLVPHSLKTYRDDAWRKFYVFDIVRNGEHVRYIDWCELVERADSDIIKTLPLLATVHNGSPDDIYNLLAKNTFLIKDGEGCGEGVVVKNYHYTNKYGRQTWAKVVTNEFKEKHTREMGAPEVNNTIKEQQYVDALLSPEVIRKVHANITSECDGWSSKYIPRLLSTVYHDFITEEMWNLVKRFKNPTVDFKGIKRFCDAKTKEVLSEVF